jgi:hypothetical protein
VRHGGDRKGSGIAALPQRPQLGNSGHPCNKLFRARNYDAYSKRPEVDLRKQYLYVGIGLNLSKLLRPYLDVPVFNYLQMPYTYVPFTYQISGPP